MLRSTGEKQDLRLCPSETYANYFYLDVQSYIGYNGDCYDRYLIRMNEMTESLHLVNQTITKLLKNKRDVSFDKTLRYFIRPQGNPYRSMEALIQHFKY